jgi:membrane protein involved in colicin uptake
MAIKQKVQQKTIAEKQAERKAELAYFAQMEADRKEREALQRADRDAFVARAQATRREFAKAQEQGETWVPDEPIPTINQVFSAKASEEKAAAAAAEAARIAALTPRDVWFSTLSFTDQQKVSVWERVNKGQKYPVPGLE